MKITNFSGHTPPNSDATENGRRGYTSSVPGSARVAVENPNTDPASLMVVVVQVSVDSVPSNTSGHSESSILATMYTRISPAVAELPNAILPDTKISRYLFVLLSI